MGDADVGERLDDVGVDVEVGEGRGSRLLGRGLLDVGAVVDGGQVVVDLVGRRCWSVWSGTLSIAFDGHTGAFGRAGPHAGAESLLSGPHLLRGKPIGVFAAATGHPLSDRAVYRRGPTTFSRHERRRADPAGPGPFSDPAYREAVVDLLGGLAYGELTAFSRLAGDAELAPTLAGKAALARLAAHEFDHYERIERPAARARRRARTAMEPFVAADRRVPRPDSPSTWLEGLVKAYVGDGIATDFYREISAYVDPGTRDLVVVGPGTTEFAVARCEFAVNRGRAAGALWGRRLVGEALSQAQRWPPSGRARRLLVGAATPGADLAGRPHVRAAHRRALADGLARAAPSQPIRVDSSPGRSDVRLA